MSLIPSSPLGIWAYIAGFFTLVGFTWMFVASMLEEREKPKD